MKVPDPKAEVEKIMEIVDLNDTGVIDYMGTSISFLFFIKKIF